MPNVIKLNNIKIWKRHGAIKIDDTMSFFLSLECTSIELKACLKSRWLHLLFSVLKIWLGDSINKTHTCFRSLFPLMTSTFSDRQYIFLNQFFYSNLRRLEKLTTNINRNSEIHLVVMFPLFFAQYNIKSNHFTKVVHG